MEKKKKKKKKKKRERCRYLSNLKGEKRRGDCVRLSACLPFYQIGSDRCFHAEIIGEKNHLRIQKERAYASVRKDTARRLSGTNREFRVSLIITRPHDDLIPMSVV